MRSKSTATVSLCFTIITLIVFAGFVPAAHAATQASRDADFLNIWGVSGHVLDYSNKSLIVSDAQYIGIKRWRDGLNIQGSPGIDILQALVNTGMTLIGIPWMNADQTISVSDHITKAKAWAARFGINAISALDGLNEPNNFPITYNGVSTGPAGNPNNFIPVAQFTRDYYAAIKADPVLHNLPLYSVNLNGAEPNNVGIQWLKMPTPLPGGVLMPAGTQYADAENTHVYPVYYDGGSTQFTDQSGDRFKEALYGNFVTTWHGFPGYTQAQADALPKVITEMGLPTAALGGSAVAGRSIDRLTQGKNIMNGLLNAWIEGYTLATIYTFYEQGTGEGLFDGPGQPKLSATYMHNLSTPLADAAANAKSFTPGALTFSLTGLPSTGKSLLLQKSNGAFELVLWNNVTNWNFSAGTPIAISPTNVTVNLTSLASSIKVYDPTVGTTPVQSLTNTNTATVTLRDYPVVLSLQHQHPRRQ